MTTAGSEEDRDCGRRRDEDKPRILILFEGLYRNGQLVKPSFRNIL